jgi:hypothetical protein
MSEQLDFSGLGFPDEPTADFMEVTPEMAEILLKFNVKNRVVNTRLVAEHVRTILAGDYLVNGETIKLSVPQENGLPVLLDGQHRLEAVVQSGKPIRILVVRGLGVDTQATIDTGRKRTSADWLKINGEKEYTTFGAVLTALWKWNTGDRMFNTNPKPTTLETTQLLGDHPEIRRSVELGVQVSRGFPDLRRSSLAVCHYIISQVDTEHVPYFMRLIESGAGLEDGHPVLALRRRASSYRRRKEPMPIRREIGLTLQAWNKCVLGEETSRIIQLINEPAPEAQHPMGRYLHLLQDAKSRTED